MMDTTSAYSIQHGSSKKKKIAIIIGVVIVVAAFAVGILMTQQPKKTDQTKVVVVEKKEPSPTEKPKIDKNSVKIQVSNGTGTPGQAGIAVEALKKAGYNPENIKAANAEEFDNSITTITARAGFEEVASDVRDSLKTTFDEVKIESFQLDEKSEFDIVVVTGGKKFEEVTPTTSIISPTNPSVSPTPSPISITTTLTPSPTSSPTPTP